MSVVINTNVDSTKIQNGLSNITTKLSKSMERMSSGLKVKSAKDDAAGCVISARMKVQLNGTQISQANVQNANAMLSTTEGNLDVVQDNLTRIRDLTLQAKNGTYSEEEIQAMDDEIQQRIDEINRISYSSKFSSSYLFNGGIPVSDGTQPTTGISVNGATFQVGSNAGTNNTITAESSLFKSVEFSAMSGASNFSLVSIYKADGDGTTSDSGVTYGNNDVDKPTADAKDTDFDIAIKALDEAIDNITARKSAIGSAGNRLDSALSSLTTQYENLESANSLIVDTDVASEASTFTQNQILQQISVSLLAQANQSPSVAMSLV